jgi:hypothetical protein
MTPARISIKKMLSEHDEFLISQLADNSIEPADRLRAESLLADPATAREASRLLESYRSLNQLLQASKVDPSQLPLDSTQLPTASDIIDHLDDASERTIRIDASARSWFGRNVSLFASAAAVVALLAVGSMLLNPDRSDVIAPVAQQSDPNQNPPIDRTTRTTSPDGFTLVVSAPTIQRSADIIIRVQIDEPLELSPERTAQLYLEPDPLRQHLLIGSPLIFSR